MPLTTAALEGQQVGLLRGWFGWFVRLTKIPDQKHIKTWFLGCYGYLYFLSWELLFFFFLNSSWAALSRL